MELTADERQALADAQASVGGTDTAAMRHRAALIARENIEATVPVGARRTINKIAIPEAVKAARVAEIEQERTVRLTKIVNSQTAAPRLKRQARYALDMMSKSAEEQLAEVRRILDELQEGQETRKALVAMRANAHGADAPVVIKAANMALAKLRDDTLAKIREREQ
jgi:hypothetical protein